MEFFILGFIIGGVLALAVSSIIHESAEGTRFGQELEAMRRLSSKEPGFYTVEKGRGVKFTELPEDVRIVFRHVPTDDGGSDLL